MHWCHWYIALVLLHLMLVGLIICWWHVCTHWKASCQVVQLTWKSLPIKVGWYYILHLPLPFAFFLRCCPASSCTIVHCKPKHSAFLSVVHPTKVPLLEICTLCSIVFSMMQAHKCASAQVAYKCASMQVVCKCRSVRVCRLLADCQEATREAKTAI